MSGTLPAVKPAQKLTCCCCGSATIGRQWWNRDTGYGLCKRCVASISSRESAEEFRQLYGERGYHCDLPAADEQAFNDDFERRLAAIRERMAAKHEQAS